MIRQGLRTKQDWSELQGVHLNPGPKTLQSTKMHYDKKQLLLDRVMYLDFDIYAKDGSVNPKMGDREVQTPGSVLSYLEDHDLPLPFFWLESNTKGNFHMAWVYSEPISREESYPFRKAVELALGADTRFTNSTMRNPIATANTGKEVHWYNEWTDSAPTLDHPKFLIPSLTELGEDAAEDTKRPTSRSQYSFIKSKMSKNYLLKVMSKATDGDGRWEMLRTIFKKILWKYAEEHDGFFSPEQVLQILNSLNSFFLTPISEGRIEAMASYWTLNQQKRYWYRQSQASTSPVFTPRKDQAVLKYFKIKKMDAILRHIFQTGEDLPSSLRTLDSSFTGERYGKRGAPTNEYLAHMTAIKSTERITSEGEVVVTSPANVVRASLANGNRKQYTEEDLRQALERTQHLQELEGLLDTLIQDFLYVNGHPVLYRGPNRAEKKRPQVIRT